MSKPTAQANPTTVFKENTINRKAAFSCMDGLLFINAKQK